MGAICMGGLLKKFTVLIPMILFLGVLFEGRGLGEIMCMTSV